MCIRYLPFQLCCGSGSQSPASHSRGPGSRPGQYKWNLWWTKWHWDRFFSKFFGLPVNIILPGLSILIYHLGDEQQTHRWPQFRDIVLPRQYEQQKPPSPFPQLLPVNPPTPHRHCPQHANSIHSNTKQQNTEPATHPTTDKKYH
jgi:hypothetical protein